MKNKKLFFIWVDDEVSRNKFEFPLEQYKISGIPRADLEFINVRGKQPLQTITKTIKNRKPDLAIIDHFLQGTKMENFGEVSKGSTVAAFVREKYHKIPIIGVTAANRLKNIDYPKRLLYDDIFLDTDFRSYKDSLFIIAYTFKKLMRRDPKDIDALIKFLNPSKEDIERLEQIMPKDLDVTDSGWPFKLFRWIWHDLLEWPGFLYDELWTSTFLGLNKAGFNKVKKLFVKAEYNGVFSSPNKKRWWKTKIRNVLYEKSKIDPKNLKMPWELGHFLRGITKKDFSKCPVCGKYFPEIVGFTDASREERVALHLTCSMPIKTHGRSLFFEEIRIIKDE